MRQNDDPGGCAFLDALGVLRSRLKNTQSTSKEYSDAGHLIALIPLLAAEQCAEECRDPVVDVFKRILLEEPETVEDFYVPSIYKSMMALLASDVEISDFAMEIIKKNPSKFILGAVAAESLVGTRPGAASTVVSDCRRILLDSTATKRVNPFAARIIAEYGDLIVTEVITSSVIQEADLPELKTFLQECIWRARIQHSEESMLEYIREGTNDRLRAWVLKNAVELGVARQEIRAAWEAACKASFARDEPSVLRAATSRAISKAGIMTYEEMRSIQENEPGRAGYCPPFRMGAHGVGQ
jgi:hypothetical protein